MRQIIKNLRQQPEEVRRHVLHVVTIICGVILLVLWLYLLGRNLSSPDTQAKINQDLKPFSDIKNNLVGGYTQSQQESNTDLQTQEDNL